MISSCAGNRLPGNRSAGIPDLNDGVRLNIRPFMTANILRSKPNINWNKDRGKNPPGSPWGDERLNDLNCTISKKIAARQEAGSQP